MNTNVCAESIQMGKHASVQTEICSIYIYRPTKGDDYTVLDRSTLRLPAKKCFIYYGLQG